MGLFYVVLLLVAATASVTVGQFLPTGGPRGFLPGSPFGQSAFGQGIRQSYGGQRSFQLPQLLTCIGTNEALDQLRITIRPEPPSYGSSPAFQYGRSRQLQKMDWRVSAVFIPAAQQGQISPVGTSSLVGNFFLGVTRYGRTEGSCAGLGGILQDEDLLDDDNQHGAHLGSGLFNNPFLGGGRFGGLGGLGPFGGASHFGGPRSPLGGLFGTQGGYGGTSHAPAGYIQDPFLIAPGGNVYSGVIRGLAEADMTGRGMAICLDAYCQRSTTTCCTVAKDSTPATESAGAAPIGPYTGNSLLSGLSGQGAVGTGLGSSGLLGGRGGLFVEEPNAGLQDLGL